MRKLLLLSAFFAILGFTIAAGAAAPLSFAGTWELDKPKSQNPPRPWQDAENVTMTITQTDKQLTIDTKVTGGNPQGGPGGGRGFGGMMGPSTFNLDGTENATESERGKSTTKSAWSKDGKTLELTTTRTFNTPNGEITSTTTEKLSLSEDGKVLTNVRHSESPRGPQDSTLVFNKKG
jgi:hypothetical protein